MGLIREFFGSGTLFGIEVLTGCLLYTSGVDRGNFNHGITGWETDYGKKLPQIGIKRCDVGGGTTSLCSAGAD